MGKSNVYRVGLLQHQCTGSRNDNLERTRALAERAVDRGAELLVSQELFSSWYFPQTEKEEHFDLAETIPGPTTDWLSELAKEKQVSICGSIFESVSSAIHYNTSVMINPNGEIVDQYRKMHIPDDPGFYEKYYFRPGDLGYRSQRLKGMRTGMLICWDQWFPEAARLTTMKGAELIMYPTAIGWLEREGDLVEGAEICEAQKDAWINVLKTHAMTNGVFTLAVNRVGLESEIRFWGESLVCDPLGRVIAKASSETDEALVVELDKTLINTARRGWPFFRDRRTDSYVGLLKPWLG